MIYYEVQSEFPEFSIGFAHKDYDSSSQIGWLKGSIGFHGDDGGIFLENYTRAIRQYEPYHVNDTYGFGIYNHTNIFFTINGKFVSNACTLKSRDPIFPMIGIFGSGKFQINYGQRPFLYSFEDLNSNITLQPLGFLRSKRFVEKYQDYVIELDHEISEDEIKEKKPKKKKKK